MQPGSIQFAIQILLSWTQSNQAPYSLLYRYYPLAHSPTRLNAVYYTDFALLHTVQPGLIHFSIQICSPAHSPPGSIQFAVKILLSYIQSNHISYTLLYRFYPPAHSPTRLHTVCYTDFYFPAHSPTRLHIICYIDFTLLHTVQPGFIKFVIQILVSYTPVHRFYCPTHSSTRLHTVCYGRF